MRTVVAMLFVLALLGWQDTPVNIPTISPTSLGPWESALTTSSTPNSQTMVNLPSNVTTTENQPIEKNSDDHKIKLVLVLAAIFIGCMCIGLGYREGF